MPHAQRSPRPDGPGGSSELPGSTHAESNGRRKARAISSAGSKNGRLQRACLDILYEHEAADELPTSGRFIFYELEGRGIVSKKATGKRRADQDLNRALTDLRWAGIVPWSWIVDETRSLSAWRYAESVNLYVRETVPQARIDLWAGEPPPVVIAESRSLAGVLQALAYQYLTPITSTNGQVGGFLHTDVAPALEAGQRVLYFGDFDWQGGQIEQNTRSVLEQLVGPLAWERLALTAEHVEEYDLSVIRKPDRRYRPVRYHDAVETEALRQGVIVKILRDRLDGLLPEPLDDVLGREHQERAAAAALLGNGAP